MPYEPSDKIGALTDAELATFLAEPWNGRIATITPEGWPYVAPVWYEFERDRGSSVVWYSILRASVTRREASRISNESRSPCSS